MRNPKHKPTKRGLTNLPSNDKMLLRAPPLDDDNIVGTDHPAKPLSRRVLDVFVAEPHVMGLFVKAQFKLRTSNKKLDDDTVEKLCSKASHTLRISECSQHEPTLGVASAIMPLTACWCVPARLRVVHRCGVLATILSP